MLPDLLGAKRTNPIESETEDEAVFFPYTNVERVVLRGDGAAIPCITQCKRGANQRAIPSAGPGLEVEKEGRPSEQASLAVAEEDRRTPLGAAQRARLLASRIGKLRKTGNQIDGAS